MQINQYITHYMYLMTERKKDIILLIILNDTKEKNLLGMY